MRGVRYLTVALYNLTPKQEKFCEAIVAGANQSAAYRIAYDAENMAQKTVYVKACLLMGEDKIAERVNQLRAPVVEAVVYGVKEAMLEADEARLIAKEDRDGSVMVQATNLKSRLGGLLTDKPIPATPLDEATTEFLLRLSDAIKQRMAMDVVKEIPHDNGG